jgi:hypothetical protein
MAMTAAQLETFSNTKPSERNLTEEIIKYLVANPGGSGGVASVYAGNISQSGTNAPTVANEYNNTGGAVTFYYNNPGDFGILGTFPNGRTFFSLTLGGGTAAFINMQQFGDNDISISTLHQNGSLANDLLQSASLMIWVVP